MLCCGILLKGISSSVSNYLWHELHFGVRWTEMLGELSSPSRWSGNLRFSGQRLTSFHVARFSLNLLCEAWQGFNIYFQVQRVYI